MFERRSYWPGLVRSHCGKKTMLVVAETAARRGLLPQLERNRFFSSHIHPDDPTVFAVNRFVIMFCKTAYFDIVDPFFPFFC